MSYKPALDLQQKLVTQRQNAEIDNTALMLEHNPVITLGARKSENKLLIEENSFAKKGIELVKVNRGGGTTAHNPGQIILYPIIHLRSLALGINDYVRQLEAIGIELLANLGIQSHQRKGLPGLWINDKKIGSIGVRVKKWVTYHGMAINIQNDLSIFDTIIPCGLNGVQITNVLLETGKEHEMSEIKDQLAKICKKHLSIKAPKNHE